MPQAICQGNSEFPESGIQIWNIFMNEWLQTIRLYFCIRLPVGLQMGSAGDALRLINNTV